MNPYGKELILDLHGCDPAKFNRGDLTRFFAELCALIDMQAEDLHFWDDQDTPENEKETEPHLVGTSAVQFIRTSNVTVHALDLLRRVYLNVFSCKDFDAGAVYSFCLEFFGGHVANRKEVDRL
jgi:S-adenosylmethionine/arginine decarboxylase-like enzyme